jgi:hypothetical protein
MPSIAPTRLPALAVAWPLGLSAVLAAFPFGSVATATAPRQEAASGTAAASDRLKLLNEVMHQVQIAKPEAATTAATALVDTGITPAELADLVDANDLGARFDRVMTRGRGLEGFATLAATLEQMLRQGRLDLARRPAPLGGGRVRDAGAAEDARDRRHGEADRRGEADRGDGALRGAAAVCGPAEA